MYVERDDYAMHGWLSKTVKKLKKSVKKRVKKIESVAAKVAPFAPHAAFLIPTKKTITAAASGPVAKAGLVAATVYAPQIAASVPGALGPATTTLPSTPDFFEKAKAFYEENKAKYDALKAQYDTLKLPQKAVPDYNYVDTGQPPVQASMFGNASPLVMIGAVSGAALLFALLSRGNRR